MKKLIEETSSQQISFGKPGYEIKTAFADIEEIFDIIGLPGLFEAKTKEFLTQK